VLQQRSAASGSTYTQIPKHLTPGLYHLRLQSSDGSRQIKVMVESGKCLGLIQKKHPQTRFAGAFLRGAWPAFWALVGGYGRRVGNIVGGNAPYVFWQDALAL